MNGLGKDYIWSELFAHFNVSFLRKVEEIIHVITDLYCIISCQDCILEKVKNGSNVDFHVGLMSSFSIWVIAFIDLTILLLAARTFITLTGITVLQGGDGGI